MHPEKWFIRRAAASQHLFGFNKYFNWSKQIYIRLKLTFISINKNINLNKINVVVKYIIILCGRIRCRLSGRMNIILTKLLREYNIVWGNRCFAWNAIHTESRSSGCRQVRNNENTYEGRWQRRASIRNFTLRRSPARGTTAPQVVAVRPGYLWNCLRNIHDFVRAQDSPKRVYESLRCLKGRTPPGRMQTRFSAGSLRTFNAEELAKMHYISFSRRGCETQVSRHVCGPLQVGCGKLFASRGQNAVVMLHFGRNIGSNYWY